MPTSYSPLLGLALPVTGELAGTWGDTVNNYITTYLDSSVAGTQTISGSQTAVTLSVTNGTTLVQVGSGSSGSAQYSIINCTGNPAATLVIDAPKASKTYVVNNATSTNQSVTLRGGPTTPTTGVTLVAGEKAVVAWNGSDFIKVATSTVDGVSTIAFGTTGLTPSSATSGAVTVAGTLVAANGGTGQSSYTTGDLLYATGSTALSKLGIGTNGQILTSTGTAPQWSTLSGVAVTTFSAGTTGFTPSSATSGAVTLAGTLATTNGGTGLTSFTANGVVYASSTSALTTGSALTFTGTNLGIGVASPTVPLDVNGSIKAVGANSFALSLAAAAVNDAIWMRFLNSAGTRRAYFGFGSSGDSTMTLSNDENGAMVFQTNATEQMRLTSTGLGIGTSSPTNALTVGTTSAGKNIAIYSSSNGNNGLLRMFDLGGTERLQLGVNSTGEAAYYAPTGSVHAWYVNTERMRLDSSGNLGLGVTPSTILDIGANNSTAKTITLRYSTIPSYYSSTFDGSVGLNTLSLNTYNTSSGSASWSAFSNTSYGSAAIQLAAGTGTANSIRFLVGSAQNTNPTEVARIDSSGNLGLGVTPSAWTNGRRALQIGGDTVAGLGFASAISETYTNAYVNSGVYKYYTTGPAGLFDFNNAASGGFSWRIAGSGTAGNTISFTQAMTLDASGNLLVGTTSATTVNSASPKLVVFSNAGDNIIAKNSTQELAVGCDYVSANTNNALRFATNNTERARIDSSGNLLVGTTSVLLGVGSTHELSLNGLNGSTVSFGYNGTLGTYLLQNASNFQAINYLNGYMSFGTNATERARITSGGDLLVGTTSNSQGSSVGNKLIGTGAMWVVNNGGNDAFSYFNTTASAYRFWVDATGTINATNTTISAISDQRFKENIQDLDVGLDKIMALKPRKFDWKTGKGKDIKGDRGFIAQEFEQVFPDLIDEWRDPAPEGEEPYKSVRQDLIPVLVKAIQEQQAIITDLRARVAQLEAK